MDSSNKDLQLTQIRHKIDGLMDLLFGAGVASHHTIIEQINYLMFLRALTKRDDEAMKIDNADKLLFTGSFAKYRWDNLLMLNAEDLFTTLEKIYREIPTITPDSTVALLYRDAHVKIYEKPTLRRLLHEIEKLMSELESDAKQGSKDIFGDMYEYLLSKQSQAGTMGQFRTPRHIIRFITEIVDPSKNETILDPACGTAGFLVAAFQHLERKYTSEKFQQEGRFPMDLLDPNERKFVFQQAFTGFDSDADMIKFGLMNLYLHQLEHPHIVRQNTLVDTAGNRDKWNIILANPPFSGALDKDSISEDLRMGTRATEILFLRYMIDHLKENGRAGVIVPEGIIFSNSTAHKKIRQILVDEAGLWCVVSLPAGIFNPYAGVKTSILFFDKSFKDVKNILFVKIENDGFDLGAQKRPIDKNDLPQALEGIKKYRQFLLTDNTQNDLFLNRIREDEKVGEILRITHDKLYIVAKKLISEDGDYNLSSDRYKIENIITNQKWPLVELGEVCDILNGYAFKSNLFNDQKKGIPIIRIRDVNSGFSETYYEGEYDKKYLVNDDDLLIGMDGDFIATLWKHGIGLLNQRVCRLENFKNVNKKYIYYLIQKELNKIHDKTYAVTVKHLSSYQVEKIKIPLPPLEVQQQIVEELDGYQKIISGARQVVENWKPKIKFNEDWEKVKLGKIFKISSGNFLPTSKRIAGKYPVYGGNGITGYHNEYMIPNSVIVIGRVGEYCGAVHLTKDHSWITDNALYVTKYFLDINQSYLSLVLTQLNIRKYAKRGGQPSINQSTIYDLDIPFPPLSEQDKIVEKIEEERKLVEGNKKLIEIYEQKIKSKIAEVWGE